MISLATSVESNQYVLLQSQIRDYARPEPPAIANSTIMVEEEKSSMNESQRC